MKEIKHLSDTHRRRAMMRNIHLSDTHRRRAMITVLTSQTHTGGER